jgi:hypothetical protein
LILGSARVTARTRLKSFPDIVEVLLGRGAARLLGVSLVVNTFGAQAPNQ